MADYSSWALRSVRFIWVCWFVSVEADFRFIVYELLVCFAAATALEADLRYIVCFGQPLLFVWACRSSSPKTHLSLT